MNKLKAFSYETYVHSVRVAEITSKIIDRLSEQYGNNCFTQEERDNLIIAAYVHDLGKLSIPNAILSKRGKFTDNEFEIMKKHSVAGYIRIKRLNLPKAVEKICSDVAIHHHRKIDGTGYPGGLDDVPYYAQIVQVADIYEALTAERSYKKALSHEKAFSMMFNGECGKLDTTLVSVMEANCNDIEQEIKNDVVDFNELYSSRYASISNR